MIPIRNAADAHAQDVEATTTCYYPPRKHLHTAIAHYTICEMLDVFSLCAAAEPPVAPTNSSHLLPRNNADTPTSKRASSPLLPSTSRTCDGGLWNREAKQYLHRRWKQHISPQSLYLFTKLQVVTSRKEYSCFHPRCTKADFLCSADTPPKCTNCLYIFLVKKNFMVTSPSTCLPQSGVWNHRNKLLASTYDTKSISFAQSEIRNKKTPL